MIDIAALLAARAQEFDRLAAEFLPCGEGPLADAMRYSMQDGGKRLRPTLVIEFCKNFGGIAENSIRYAVSLEMMHTYSLIHDDMPCMDNDDFRRGRLSCHRKFGEAVALLAGDALLTQAFAVIAGAEDISEKQRCKAINYLAESGGLQGMVGGQILDLAYEKKEKITYAQLEDMNRKKTGALIQLACRFGCMAADAGEAEFAAAEAYADALGLLFQVTDDILDVTGKRSDLGKTTGKDVAFEKSTWVSVLGLQQAKAHAKELAALACQAIAPFIGEDSFLYCLPEWLVDRKY